MGGCSWEIKNCAFAKAATIPFLDGHRVATPGACYRGPKPQKCPKWLGEGAKGVSDPGSKGLPRVFCSTETLFCTGATLFCTSARGLWRPGPEDLLHPLLTTLGTLEVLGPCSRHPGSQPQSEKMLARGILDFFFNAAPHVEYFSKSSSSALKRHLLKQVQATFDTL